MGPTIWTNKKATFTTSFFTPISNPSSIKFYFLIIPSVFPSTQCPLLSLQLQSINCFLASSVQSLSRVQLGDPWTAACQDSLPVHHQLPELTQTHVHWVSDAIQPFHPLLSPSLPAFLARLKHFSNWSSHLLPFSPYCSHSSHIHDFLIMSPFLPLSLNLSVSSHYPENKTSKF